MKNLMQKSLVEKVKYLGKLKQKLTEWTDG